MKLEYKIAIGSALFLGLLYIAGTHGASTGGINNPGNIRNSNVKFLGETTKPGDIFKSFVDLQHGIRAMFVILNTYRSRYNLATIRGMFSGIVSTYAPSSENDTETYISYVAKKVGIDSNAIIPVNKYPAIVMAMTEMEGRRPVTLAEAQNTYTKFFA